MGGPHVAFVLARSSTAPIEAEGTCPSGPIASISDGANRSQKSRAIYVEVRESLATTMASSGRMRRGRPCEVPVAASCRPTET